jgi:hypothetical protein
MATSLRQGNASSARVGSDLPLRCSHVVCSAAPASLPRYVPKGGLSINGIFLRPGTVISTQAYTMHRLKDVFGPDADDWRPERWLIEDQSEIKKMDKHMMPFGQGELGLELLPHKRLHRSYHLSRNLGRLLRDLLGCCPRSASLRWQGRRWFPCRLHGPSLCAL